LAELYGNVISQWRRYMGHVTTYIGGVYETYKTFDQEGGVYEVVDEADQRRSMEFLQEYAFSTPTWAFNRDILDRINESTAVETFRSAQSGVLNGVLNPARIARLTEAETRTDADTYTLFEMMDDLRNGIFSELRANENVDVHRRHLQRAYVERMEYLMTQEPSGFFGSSVDVSQSDIRPAVRNQLTLLRRDSGRRISAGNIDRATRVHLEDTIARIDSILEEND